jgi:hypothetical protein
MSSLLDLLAGLARFCQSHEQTGSDSQVSACGAVPHSLAWFVNEWALRTAGHGSRTRQNCEVEPVNVSEWEVLKKKIRPPAG